MTDRLLLGMLTPSSNTVLEPVTAAMLAGVPEATAHFSRFRVTEIGLSADALAQFDPTEILRAADLLADARVRVIGWSGTSAGWLGFEADERLCAGITESTGVAACTSVLAINELLRRLGARRLGFVTPYVDDVQARINANYTAAGFEVAADRHLGWSDNWSFSTVTAHQLQRMTADVAASRPDAIVVLCTGLRAAPLVDALEREFDIPIVDSVAAVVWRSLVLAGADPRRVTGWGRVFRVAA